MSHSMITIACFVVTIACYYLTKLLHKRYQKIWLIPLVSVPFILVALVISLHIAYQDYIGDSHWLVWMLGPATVAFAVPVHENRKIIVRHWLSISVGVIAAIITAISSTVYLSKFFHLSEVLQRSLAVRSITTPFAVVASKELGGKADLTAIFVVLTGVFGIICAEIILGFIRIKSPHGKGAGLGACAHGSGTAIAYGIHSEAGTVASLVMLFSGVATVLIAPCLSGLF
ncbi:LrgB family protein [Vibrio gallicus]|uniref:LrgB family protein n=1 Tax=Vibrio gallicus TaxID=190897 RepID=UPI0021C3E7EE|nr:LrgB family protein [Vibrio gallicus]